MTDRGNPAGWQGSGPPYAGPVPSPPVTGQSGSPWWTDALHDPWRDPHAGAAVTVPGVPVDSGPPLEPVPEPPGRSDRPGLRMVLLVALFSALLAGGLGGALGYVAAARNGVGGQPGVDDPPPLAKRPPDSVAGVVKEAMPSLVTVTIRSGGKGGNGSGFVISADGYVVTNEHVALGAGRDADIQVVFSDGSKTKATVVGSSASSDIAVLKVARKGLTPITFGDSDKVAVGDPVIAVGAPMGLRDTVTTGVVSALDRAVAGGDDDPSIFAAIQTDAPINPGNSGGALLDGAGRVIGVNTAIYTVKSGEQESGGSIGLGFAIPINQARRVATEIVQTGHARTPVIGAELDMGYKGGGGGVRLSTVEPGGPAADAGLKGGDIVTRFGGRTLTQAIDLVALIRKHAPGTVVSVEYLRGAEKHTARITLGADG
ncbi:MAG: S1C family serine protease [Micromonosporaceae bacterium]